MTDIFESRLVNIIQLDEPMLAARRMEYLLEDMADSGMAFDICFVEKVRVTAASFGIEAEENRQRDLTPATHWRLKAYVRNK